MFAYVTIRARSLPCLTIYRTVRITEECILTTNFVILFALGLCLETFSMRYVANYTSDGDKNAFLCLEYHPDVN
jgi:hypothetical protein